MKPDSPSKLWRGFAPLLAGGLIAAISISARAAGRPAPGGGDGSDAPAFEKQVNLVYTVNNFGFIDVCG